MGRKLRLFGLSCGYSELSCGYSELRGVAVLSLSPYRPYRPYRPSPFRSLPLSLCCPRFLTLVLAALPVHSANQWIWNRKDGPNAPCKQTQKGAKLPCRDFNTGCRAWASAGDCDIADDAAQTTVQQLCPLSCGACT